MKIGVPRETFPGENRVAVIPPAVVTLKKTGLDVIVEYDAGTAAGFTNAAYEQAGATVSPRAEVFSSADILLQVRAIPADTSRLRRGPAGIGFPHPPRPPPPISPPPRPRPPP